MFSSLKGVRPQVWCVQSSLDVFGGMLLGYCDKQCTMSSYSSNYSSCRQNPPYFSGIHYSTSQIVANNCIFLTLIILIILTLTSLQHQKHITALRINC